jgi:hypothetical protein
MAHSSSPTDMMASLNLMAQAIVKCAGALELALNPMKTQLLIAGPHGLVAQAETILLEVDGAIIAPSNEIDVLGFRFNKCLTSAPYLKHLQVGLQQVAGIVCRTQLLLPPNVHAKLALSLCNGQTATYPAAAAPIRLPAMMDGLENTSRRQGRS